MKDTTILANGKRERGGTNRSNPSNKQSMGNEAGKHAAAPSPDDKAARSVKRMSTSMQRRLGLGVDFNSELWIGLCCGIAIVACTAHGVDADTLQ